MGHSDYHAKLSRENHEGAHSEYLAGRFSNVGLLAIRALEQIIEACAAKENLHFHENPKTAHRRRRDWLLKRHSDLVKNWDDLWFIYGELGYGGVNGEKARRALQILNRTLRTLAKREKIGRL